MANAGLEKWNALKQQHTQQQATGTATALSSGNIGQDRWEQMKQQHKETQKSVTGALPEIRNISEASAGKVNSSKLFLTQLNAKRAKQEYEDYINSEEYQINKRNQVKIVAANQMAAGTADMLNLSPYSMGEDPKERELRAKVEAYDKEISYYQDRQVMLDDLEELGSWPEADRNALITYVSNREREAYSGLSPLQAFSYGNARAEATALFQKYGAKKVQEMAESYTRSQNEKLSEDIQEYTQEAAGKNGALHSVGSVGANLIGNVAGPLGYLVEAGQRSGRYETMDPNNAGNVFFQYASGVREKVVSDIEGDGGIGRKAASVLYQGAMSAADSIARMVMGGGNQAVSLGLAGAGSFAQTLSSASKQGAKPWQAALVATASAGAEVLTEKIPLDDLLKVAKGGVKGAGNIIKEVFKQATIEATTEEISLLANLAAEASILQEKSSYNQKINELVMQGRTIEQARAEANKDIWNEAVQTALISGVSGGMSAGGGIIVGNIGNRNAGQNQDDNKPAESQTIGEEITRQIRNNWADNPEPKVTVQPEANVGEEVVQSAQRIAKATGRNVVFYSNYGTKNGTQNGYYQDGTIYINSRSENPLAQIFSHELTHSVEMADAYKDLSALVMQRIQATGGNLQQMRQAKAELYAQNGHALKSEADVDAEIVAEYVEKNLLTNEQSIVSLTQENPTLGRRILNWIDGLLAKLGNTDAQTRAFLNKARNIYSKALSQSQAAAMTQVVAPNRMESGSTVATEATKETSNQAVIDWAREQYSAGVISEAEFDGIVDAIMEQEGLEGTEEKYSITDLTSESVNSNAHQLVQEGRTQNADTALYNGKDLANDREIYSYDFLVSLPDMQAVNLPSVMEIRNHTDKVDTSKVLDLGMKNALSVGTERDGKVYVTNRYSGRELRVDKSSIRHGLNGGMSRLLTNARLGSVIGEVVQNAVPINALYDTAKDVTGTYAMAGYATDENGREFVAIITVEQRDGSVSGIDVFDVTHAVSGRQKRDKQVDTKSQGVYPSMLASKISIKDLLTAVKSTYQSILPNDVLSNLGEVRNPNGYYSGRTKFSISEPTVNKRDVATDLRAILSRGGSAAELRSYVQGLEQNTPRAEQSRSEAERILRSAKRQGIGVEEYLRQNWEQYDSDGEWNQDARAALELERRGRRQYSIADGEDTGDTEQTDVRSTLPAKARNYLAGAERKLLNDIGEKLGVPRFARREKLQAIVQEISDEYLRNGTVAEDKAAELFDKAYAEGIVIDRQFYDENKEIKDHLRNTAVTLSDRDKADIADFQDFRRQAWGTLKITNEGGLPVDTAYQELHSMAPALFSENITHPADQLRRMYDVGRSIQISKKSLDEFYGEDAEEFRSWARNDFDAAVGEAIGDLRQVKRYTDDRNAEDPETVTITADDAAELWKQLKDARKTYEKAMAKNLLTESDSNQVARLLKGEIQLEHLDPAKDNVKGITAVYEAKQEYERLCAQLAEYKRQIRSKRLRQADECLQTANDWKDKRAGIQYSRETMRRNIYDIIPDKALAEKVNREFFETVHTAEAESTRFKTEFRDKVRGLGLDTKVQKGNLVSEAHAVQLLGEATDNIRVLERLKGRMSMRDGKNLKEWQAVVDNLWMENPGLNKAKIEKAVADFRVIYDDLFQKMNRVRIANGYEPVNYRQGYFPHFQPDGDGIMAHFGKALGISTQVDALPTTINGLTHTFKPGIQWFGNAQERLGFNTAYDAVEGFDKYIEGVASVIYQTENIQKLRAFATQARYRTSDEGIRKQVDAVLADTRLTEDEKQSKIRDIYENGKYTLSNFVNELDEYTNLLANKKSKLDRTMEALIGRKAYSIMKAWENRVGANMIAGNITSAMTNFIPLTQARAQLDRGMVLRGMWDTLKAMKYDDGIAGSSSFLTNRRGSDPLIKTWTQKASAVLGTPMELIDNFTSEAVLRAAYLQNRKQGLSEAEAMYQADIFASNVMADRSKGAMPTLFESRNPLLKAFTQFQLEVNNQFSEVVKDLPRNYKEKGLAVLAMVLLKYFLGAFLYNEVYEYFVGRRPALDPFGILNDAVGDITGYELPNLVELSKGAITGDMPTFETEAVGFGEAGKNLTNEALSSLPFASGLTLFGIETDGGRIPASSAIPDLSTLWDAATEEGWSTEKRWKEVQDELNKLAYVVPPFGGNQISKIWKGIDAYLEGGSYSLDNDGNEILQYPVYKDEPEDAFWSLVRATILGKSSLPEAQDWVEGGFDSLTKFETAVYQDMLDAEVSDRDAYNLIDRLRDVPRPEGENGAAAQRENRQEILLGADISEEGKAIAFYGMVATDAQKELMNALTDAGAGTDGLMKFIIDFWNAENLKGLDKWEAQQQVLASASLTEEEKTIVVGKILGTDMETDSGKPSQYAKFLTAQNKGLSVDEYMALRSADVSIDKFLELTDTGIGAKDAAELAKSLSSLEPSYGEDDVSWLQKSRAILDTGISEAKQMAALASYMPESDYGKLQIGYDLGVTPESYIRLREVLPAFDENANGNYTQAEVKMAIDAMSLGGNEKMYALLGVEDDGLDLSNTQKAILWQLSNKSWKPNKNPYDMEVSQDVYDLLNGE